ncbi:MAG: kelch repeat-containing protein [Myxococcota bacterium]|nr:kelch repeat-containing protein [Myxococcota bacterium]
MPRLWLPILLLASSVSASPWAPTTPIPTARQEVAVAVLGGEVYVIGGFDANRDGVPTVEIYTPAPPAGGAPGPDTGSWRGAAPLPVALHHAAAVGLGGRVYVIGGWLDLFQTASSSVFAYDPALDEWTPVASLPAPRGELAAVVWEGRIYAVGGSRALFGEEVAVDDFAVYDPALDEWTPLPPLPSPRNHLAAGAIAGRIYAAGGRSPFNVGTLEAYDVTLGQWLPPLASLPTARSGIAGAVLGGRLFVFGGEQFPTLTFDEVEAYDPRVDRWAELTPMPVGKHGIGAGVVGDRIYVPAGAPLSGFDTTDLSDVYRPGEELDLDGDDVEAGTDVCPDFFDPDQGDAEGDGVGDACDNCTLAANPDQRDTNAPIDDAPGIPGEQRFGDACDADLDDDGTVAPSDFFSVLRPCLGASIPATPACAVADLDGDGVVGPSDFFGGLRPALGSAPGPGLTR